MKLSMDITLQVGKVLNLQQLKGSSSFKESFDVDFQDMTDEEFQCYMNPTDEDYVRVPVRMLSAAAVQNDTINFGHLEGKALKEAVELFDNLVILKDHRFSVEEWLGKTEGPFWDSNTPGAPAGVTGIMKLDKKADPKTCRGVVSGVLDSVSVTISFEYERSHPKMSDMDFYMRLGDVVDGKTVQALVTKVNRVYELSVVWQGADKYAKTVGEDGSIHTPGVRSNSQSFSTSEVSVDLKKLAALLGLTLEGAALTEDAILAALKEKLAANPELQTKLTAAETAKTELTAQITQLTADLDAKKGEIQTLQTKVTGLEAQAKVGETTLSNTRSEALRLYNLVEDKKATESMRALIGNANLEVAQSFIDSYKDRAEQIAPLKCTKCGCTELSRQQGKQPEVPNAQDKPKTGPEAARLKTAVSSIHG